MNNAVEIAHLQFPVVHNFPDFSINRIKNQKASLIERGADHLSVRER